MDMCASTLGVLIKSHIRPRQILLTPGTGNPPRNQRRFMIGEVSDCRIVFDFPKSRIVVRFTDIEVAIREMRRAGGEVRIGAYQGWAERGTLENFLQEARGNQLRTANYVAPVLVECGVASYVMNGQAKAIRLANPAGE